MEDTELAKEQFFSQIPNKLLETLMMAQIQGLITGRERSIIDFIIRHTYGFHKEIGIMKTSFMAKELETTQNYVTHLLKRLRDKNIIVKNGSEISINENFNEWKGVKLPHRTQKSDSPITNVTAVSRDSADTKNVTALSLKCDNPVTSDPEQEQLKTESINSLNKTYKYNINKTTKREINIKERKITFNNQIFKFENIPKEKLEKWKEVFVNCNVDLELKKMEAWLAANPDRLKKNYEKFIVNWLGRAKGEENAKNKGNNGRYIPITGKRKFTGLDTNAGEW